MEASYGKKGRAKKVINKREERVISGQDLFCRGGRDQQGFYHADYLPSANQRISDRLLQGRIPERVEAVIKSWYAVVGGKWLHFDLVVAVVTNEQRTYQQKFM